MNAETIRDLLGPILAEGGFTLVEVTVKPAGRRLLVQVYADKPGGISLDDCAWISRQLGGRLDLNCPDAGSYQLEVSSPGIDRKLHGPADAALALGKPVKAWTREAVAGRLEHRGRLQAVTPDRLRLENPDGTATDLPWALITTAKLDPRLNPDGGKRTR